MTPRATYRIQFNRKFGFADAEAIVPYLDRLGISHVYASPITVAQSGSMHGYDVVDPTRVNPELGGEEALRKLVGALRVRGMGLIIDIVPNHMGVGGNENPWWNDVLKHGPASRYARFFDVDWREKLFLPILGAPLDDALGAGDITLDMGEGEPAILVYGERRLPIRPEDHAGLSADVDLADLLGRQHYRLGWWRASDDELNWRRFFTINELAGLRVEDPQVFEAAHALYFRLYREGMIDGVRVDHVDGLSDPAGYCGKLRERLDGIDRPADAPPGPAYFVVEKILGAGEELPPGWCVDGTSGYDFMEDVAALLHDPAGEAPLTAVWDAVSGRTLEFPEEELQARRDMLSWAFEAQLGGCVGAFHALAQSARETRGLTRGMLRRAVERLLWVFPVYRTYGTGADAPASDARVREQVRQRVRRYTPPGETEPADRILAWLAGEGPGDAALAADAVRRFQQLSAPIAAKAVEDTAFYRYGRLLSRTDVGFDAGRFAASAADFHVSCERRARRFPAAMLATATHDHKRGEDARARLAVLSTIPDIWRKRVEGWERMAQDCGSRVHPADRYILYQTLFGSWPPELDGGNSEDLDAYAERIAAWQTKALREAKLRSSWEQPDQAYEEACGALVARLLDPDRSSAFLADLGAFVIETAAATSANVLVQSTLRNLVPGVPDLYQGTELSDFSLVDPDNRRPVDFAAREALLVSGDAGPKLALLQRLLQTRREHPGLFARGDYERLEVRGPRAGNVLAFTRREGGTKLICAVAIRCGAVLHGGSALVPDAGWWADTALPSGGEGSGGVLLRDLLPHSPVYFSIGG